MGGPERDLAVDEGVDEGSSDSVNEAIGAVPPVDLLGKHTVGLPENGEQHAAPVPIETGSDEPSGPGQRQQVGER
jgi:hypothetical protein